MSIQITHKWVSLVVWGDFNKGCSKSMQGYFKTYRSLLNSDLWLGERFTRGQAWIDLIGLARHTDGQTRVAGEIIKIKRGQVARSIVNLSLRWKWNKKTTMKFLKELSQSEHQILVEPMRRITLITVINYDKYQGEIYNEYPPEYTPPYTPEIEENGTKLWTPELRESYTPESTQEDNLIYAGGENNKCTPEYPPEYTPKYTPEYPPEYTQTSNELNNAKQERVSKQKDHIPQKLPTYLPSKNLTTDQEQINADYELKKRVLKLIGQLYGVVAGGSYKSALIRLIAQGEIHRDNLVEIDQNPPDIDPVVGQKINRYMELRQYEKSSLVLNRVGFAIDYFLCPPEFSNSLYERLEKLEEAESKKAKAEELAQAKEREILEAERIKNTNRVVLDLCEHLSPDEMEAIQALALENDQSMNPSAKRPSKITIAEVMRSCGIVDDSLIKNLNEVTK